MCALDHLHRRLANGPTGNPPAITEATARKRARLVEFTRQKLAPHSHVQAVVAFGSLATGTARPDSDLDAYVLMDPLDLYLVPAESIWRQSDDTFHSIFSEDPSLQQDGLQLDFHRVDLKVWNDPAYVWPEHVRAELADGWVAFDRHGAVASLIAARTSYPDEDRIRIIDDAVTIAAGQLLGPGEIPQEWHTLGPADAHDGLQVAYESLVHALFAYNQRWRPWRNREMRTLLRLPWLPPTFSTDIIDAAVATGHDQAAYLSRAAALQRLLTALLEQLVADGIYRTENPTSEAFIRTHDEPGRAWNMTTWNATHNRNQALPQ